MDRVTPPWAPDGGMAVLGPAPENRAERRESGRLSPWKRHLDRAVPVKVKCLTMNNFV